MQLKTIQQESITTGTAFIDVEYILVISTIMQHV